MAVPKICVFYNYEEGCRNQQEGKLCPHLHICKHYITDRCKFGRGCKRNHDIFTPDVVEILNGFKINIRRKPKEIIAELREGLSQNENDSRSETREVFDPRPRTTDPSLVSKRDVSMQKLPLYPYSRGSDTSEVFDSRRRTTSPSMVSQSAMFKQKLPLCLQPDLSVSGLVQRLSLGSDGAYGDARTKSSRSGRHICLYNLRGQCCFGGSCRNVHTKMPYQWQIRYQSDGEWEDLEEQDNLDVELNFSKPECDDCFCVDRAGIPIHFFFEKMEAKKGDNNQEVQCLSTVSSADDKKKLEVRRLSTVSSEDAENQPLATKWCWFWQDRRGKWVEYGSKDETGYEADLVSDKMEQKYLANPKGQCQFVTQGFTYIMDFTTMTQQNMETKTKRRAKRRPEYVSSKDAEIKKHQPVQSGVLPSHGGPRAGIGIQPCPVPTTWNVKRGQDIIDICNRVEVTKMFNREEYQKVETLFFESMPSTTSIITIERIENGELWANYNNKKVKMQKKNPALKELFLFHGTQLQYIDAICRQGFDFRLGGESTGARFGKGSYFAKAAKFADRYTEIGNCTVFLVKVLAGDYTTGDKKYTRPPLKDPRNPCSDLYDSCVDDVINPKIFVIFDNYQVYPEYMIKYNMN